MCTGSGANLSPAGGAPDARGGRLKKAARPILKEKEAHESPQAQADAGKAAILADQDGGDHVSGKEKLRTT